MKTKQSRLARLTSRLANRDGAAAVEFAILAPILVLVLAGAVDFGGVVFTRFGLDNTVSSAANYALNAKASVNGTSGGTLAQTISAVISNSGATQINGTVTINNGPMATITNGVATISGTAANANSCYCPTRSGATITWGSAATCGSACDGGGKAGKFVVISVSRTYTPFFSNYGFIDEDQQISTMTVAQTE